MTDRPGIPCPRCGSVQSATLDTRKKGGAIKRRRECFKCGAWFSTEEKSIVEPTRQVEAR